MTEYTRLLTSAQAAARLGVKPATLYAYVSRGLIERHPSPDGRTSLYDPSDLARLERRSTRRGGSPTEIVVASELTLIDGEGGRLYYRGLDPVEACRSRRFEEIAGWLWTGNFDGTGVWRAEKRAAVAKDGSLVDRIVVTASTIASSQRRTPPIAQATELMSSLVESLPGPSASSGSSFAERLRTKLAARPLVRVLDAALSLTADHGLTYSALVARVTAATGADVASSVAAAMQASKASIRGSHLEELERAFVVASEHGVAKAVSRLSSDVLDVAVSTDVYRSGDPRGRVLLDLLSDAAPEHAELARAMAAEIGGPPAAAFAHAAVSWASGMRPGSAEVISILSRTAGWIAHAFEEYRRPTPFRPRLAYTGPAPRATPVRMLDAVQGYLARE